MPLRFLSVLLAALPFSIALCAAFAMLLPGGWRHSAIGVMVLSIPVWVGTASWWVGVASHRRLAAYLAGGNFAAFALLYAAQWFGSAS